MIKPYGIINGKDYWELNESIYINEKEKVPYGFVLDFGSYPRLIWFIIHPLNIRFLEANAIHDYRYSRKDKSGITRYQADIEFYNNCLKSNRLLNKKRTPILAFIFYITVRLFGWIGYKKPLPFEK